MTFECTAPGSQAVSLSFKTKDNEVRNNSTGNGAVSKIMNLRLAAYRRGTEYKNVNVTCALADRTLPSCTLNLIPIAEDKKSCNSTAIVDSGNIGELSCNPTMLADHGPQARSGSLPSFLSINSPFGSNLGKEQFDSVLRYAFLHNNTWIDCNKTDENGSVIVASKSLRDHTKTIKCPIVLKEKPQTVIVRIETEKKSALAAGMPSLAPESEKGYTYISVSIDATAVINEEGGFSDTVTGILAAVIGVLLIIVITCCVCITRHRKKRQVDKVQDRFLQQNMVLNHPNNAAAENGTAATRRDADLELDALSMATETTSPYERFQEAVMGRLGLFSPKLDLGTQLEKRRAILERQLSGDPSKINPEMCLNQQVSCLSYDPKREIDRSNFTIGKLLGSGNYGSVWDGVAR